MNYYDITLALAKPNSKLSLIDKEKVLETAIIEYNSKPMQNPKNITKLELTEAYLRIRLESALPLNSTGKALRTFSKILLNDPDFVNQVTPNGQLFSTVTSSPTPADHIPKQDTIDVNTITDIELIHSLIDHVFHRKDTDSTIYRTKKKQCKK
jgi:hypothetical protein